MRNPEDTGFRWQYRRDCMQPVCNPLARRHRSQYRREGMPVSGKDSAL